MTAFDPMHDYSPRRFVVPLALIVLQLLFVATCAPERQGGQSSRRTPAPGSIQ